MLSKDYNNIVEQYRKTYADLNRSRGVFYLETMARLYAQIGRANGSTCKPWVSSIPDGEWAITELDGRVLHKLAELLDCTPDDLRGER